MIDLRDENAKNTINGGKYSNLNIPGKLKKLTIKIIVYKICMNLEGSNIIILCMI